MIGKTINACLSKVATFSTIILITIALSLLGCKGSTVEVKNLPWQISLNEAGQVEVFDVTLGKSTLTEAVNQWRVEAKVALFESPEGEQSLEGYFWTRKTGSF